MPVEAPKQISREVKGPFSFLHEVSRKNVTGTEKRNTAIKTPFGEDFGKKATFDVPIASATIQTACPRTFATIDKKGNVKTDKDVVYDDTRKVDPKGT